MKKQEMISELNNVKIIAHRLGYQMTKYPENSIGVLETIFQDEKLLDSCDGFEFDVCFTKDRIPVVLHDKFIDDVSDGNGLISNYTLAELKLLNFSFRKSHNLETNDIIYKIMSLDDLLKFFLKNKKLLKDKEIKIETKDYLFTRKNTFNIKNFIILAEIINKYPSLNITHLSYWPLNLIALKYVQNKRHCKITKADYLCDLGLSFWFSRFMPFLGRVSLRIRDNNLLAISKSNSKLVNKKIKFDNYWMKKSKVINEKNIKYCILKFGSVGFYTLNKIKDIEEFSKNVSYEFFKDNLKYMTFTSNNPKFLRDLEKEKK